MAELQPHDNSAKADDAAAQRTQAIGSVSTDVTSAQSDILTITLIELGLWIAAILLLVTCRWMSLPLSIITGVVAITAAASSVMLRWRIIPRMELAETTRHAIETAFVRHRKESDEANKLLHLRESSIDAMAITTALVSSSGKIIHVSKSWHNADPLTRNCGLHGELGDNFVATCMASDFAEVRRIGNVLTAALSGALGESSIEYTTREYEPRYFDVRIRGFECDGARYAKIIRIEITALRRAQQRIESDGERLKLALEGGKIGCLDWNPQTGQVVYDERWAMLLGEKLEEITPLDDAWRYRVHPDDLSTSEQALNACLNGQTELFEVEQRLRHRNGNYRWFLARGRVVTRDSMARPTRMVCTHQDITERKLSSERAAEHQRVLRAIVDVLPQSIFWKDREGSFLGGNAAFCRDVGTDDLIGKTDLDLCATPGQATQFRKSDIRVMSSRRSEVNAVRRMRMPDGRMIWLATNKVPLTNADGEVIGVVGTYQDISAIKNTEEELRRKQQLLEETGSMAHVGAWELDGTTQELLWSPEVFQIYGTSPDEPPDVESAISFYASDAQEVIRNAVQNAIDYGMPFDVTLPFVTKQGEHRWVHSLGKAERRDDGSMRLYGAFQDVTEAKQIEEALIRARETAETANQAKSEFLANMSHEIRTPLTAILGFTDILREELDPVLDAQRREPLETIRKAGQHLLTIINDILDLSKIEAGRMDVEHIETDLPRLLSEVESMLTSRAQGKGIDFSVSLATPIPERIVSDPTRLRQVLMNLTGNAIKFTASGTVKVVARIDSRGGSPVLCIRVQDTGSGLSDEERERLFRPFSQADASVSRRHGGSGLGLTISLRLTRLMGGDVRLVHSAPGEGSTFEMSIPLLVPAEAQMVSQLLPLDHANELHGSTGQMPLSGRILVAEDGPDNQRLISHHLTRAGAKVLLADNGRIALEMLERARSEGRTIDLLITDIQMPEMDGYALVRKLRDDGWKIPILALTAHAMAEDRQRCMEAGCNDFASKPIDKRQLLDSCRRWLNAKAGSNGSTPSSGVPDTSTTANTDHANTPDR